MILPRLILPGNLIIALLLLLFAGGMSCGHTDVQTVTNSTANNPIKAVKVTLDKTKPALAAAVVYRSLDKGKSWESFANGIPQEATLSSIVQSQKSIYLTTDYHGVFKSRDGENNWQAINSGLPKNIDVNCLVATDDKLTIGTLRQGVFISKDGGLNWQAATKNIDSPIRAFIQTKDKIIAGTDTGFFESKDQGNSWTHTFGQMQILGFTALNNKLYAAVFNGAMMSTDLGKSWQYIYEFDALHDIANDGTYIYAMTIGLELLRTKNDGATWENAQQGIPRPPNYYTNELKNIDQHIFSAQWIGIYHSMDNGSTWNKLEGLPEVTAFSTLEVTDFGIVAGISIR